MFDFVDFVVFLKKNITPFHRSCKIHHRTETMFNNKNSRSCSRSCSEKKSKVQHPIPQMARNRHNYAFEKTNLKVMSVVKTSIFHFEAVSCGQTGMRCPPPGVRGCEKRRRVSPRHRHSYDHIASSLNPAVTPKSSVFEWQPKGRYSDIHTPADSTLGCLIYNPSID